LKNRFGRRSSFDRGHFQKSKKFITGKFKTKLSQKHIPEKTTSRLEMISSNRKYKEDLSKLNKKENKKF